MTAFEALKMIAEASFRPFDKYDFDAWQGVETENPLYGESGDWAIVIDGDVAQFEKDGNWFTFNLKLTFEA